MDRNRSALVAWPSFLADFSKAGPMSIEIAVTCAERSSPNSSKKQSSVAVSLPSLPQTNLPVSWFDTNVT
jgi:hypothetical protein